MHTYNNVVPEPELVRAGLFPIIVVTVSAVASVDCCYAKKVVIVSLFGVVQR